MAYARTWDASYEVTPADSTLAKLLGARIRDFKTDVRERLEQEHYFGSSETYGGHKFGVGNTAARTAAIATPKVGMVWYNTTFNCWQIYDGSNWINAGDHGIGTTATRDGLASPPTNMKWLSTDEGFHSYYNGTAWITLGNPGLFHGNIKYATAATVTLVRGNRAKLRVEVDGVVLTSAADITIDVSNASDREDASEASSTWYYLYVFNNSNAIGKKISSTAPVMDPATGKVGYHPTNTGWRCIGAVFNDNTSSILPFDRDADGWIQLRKPYATSPFTVTHADPSGTTSYASQSIAGALPATARYARLSVYGRADALGFNLAPEGVSGLVGSNPAFCKMEFGAAGAAARETTDNVIIDIPVDASPTYVYGSDNASTDFTELKVRVMGWRDDFGY